MSAPQTDPEKQAHRHKTPLVGMGAAVGIAIVLLVVLMIWMAGSSDEPEGADQQIEGTGEIIQSEEPPAMTAPETPAAPQEPAAEPAEPQTPTAPPAETEEAPQPEPQQ